MAGPNKTTTLKDILPAELQKDDPAKGITWKTMYGQITRGDLMLLGGWIPTNLPDQDLGPWPRADRNNQNSAPVPPLVLSGKLRLLDVDDFRNLARILEKHNGNMSYGTTAYFCCSCV